MTNEKKPSIYDDRGTIGSSAELDEYGVWVKSEPQDLFSVGVDAQGADISGPDDLDFTIPEIEELPDFDLPPEDESAGAESEDDFELPVMEEDTGFETAFDLDTAIDVSEEENGAGPDMADSAGEADFEDADPDSGENSVEVELELPDFLQNDKTMPGGVEPLDFSFDENTDFADSADSNEDENSGDFTEVPLDDFLGTLDAEPEITDGAEETLYESAADSSAFSAEELPQRETPRARDEAGPDLSTQLLMKIAEELASIRSELTTLKRDFSGLKAADSRAERKENLFGEEDDEKIALTGDELNNILSTAEFTEESGADASIQLSETQDAAEAEEPFASADFDTDENSAAESGAGDELINLMDLDIGLDEAVLEELSAEPDDDNAAGESPETGELDISLDMEEALPLEDEVPETAPEEALPDFVVEETDELRQIRENGAEPITFAPAPEDADYLTEDPLADELLIKDSSEAGDFSAEAIDLSGAVIDEPDLSAEIQDNPLEEPSPEDISISLDPDETSFGGEDGEDSGGNEPEEELEFLTDLPEDDEEAEELFDTDGVPGGNEEGGDLSLIPEGFFVEAEAPGISPEENEEESVSDDLNILASETDDLSTEIAESETIQSVPEASPAGDVPGVIPVRLKHELKTVLSYMDQLLESLPDEKIEEFARSEYFDTYKKLFKELGLA